MRNRIAFLALLLLFPAITGSAEQRLAATTTVAVPHPATTEAAGRWEAEIVKFEAQDRKIPPPVNSILFVGSSTIRIWKVSDAFSSLPVINRGFGGSQVVDVLNYYDRIVLKYHPKTIVFYSGDNDLAAKKSPQQVVADVTEFVTRVRKDLPKTKLIYIGIKPSVLRWKLIDSAREANRQIKPLIESRPGDVFIDTEPLILGADGKPQADLFRADGLHLNEKGYDALNAAVKPYLIQ